MAVLLTACREEETETNTEKSTEAPVSYAYSPLGPIIELQPSVEDSLREWTAFWELQEEMEIFRSKNTGDLSFNVDELIRIEKELLHDSIPEKVKLPAVKSRSLVFRTLAYKLKDQVEHRISAADIDSTRVKMLESYNAFRFHIADALREKVYEDFLNRDTTRPDSIPPVKN
ncbi:hypothetical protein [Robertkochia flava]|uniref:hypothetical protein n=1 Tax=Robertkochia flava TaxID=3447986 RepID=UPI001CCE4C65|nr:hypothetical protein [Robertkochia marina]